MSNSPLISIIIPVYNVRAWLKPCLDSLAAQTFSPLEIVLVEDGSTDGSEEVLSDFCAKHSYARLLKQPHAGAASARILGMEQARGEYVVFVDGDDTLPADYIETLWKTARISQAPLVVVPIVKFDGELPDTLAVPPLFYERILTGPERVKIFEDCSAVMSLSGKLIARELLAKLIPMKSVLQNGEDIAPTIQLISSAEQIAFSAETYYFYRQHPASQSHSGLKRFSNLITGFSQARAVLKQDGNYETFAPGFEYVCRVFLCSFMEVNSLCREEEDFLRAHRNELRVAPGLFSARSFKFRVRQWLFDKSLEGRFSYFRLLHWLRRLTHRA